MLVCVDNMFDFRMSMGLIEANLTSDNTISKDIIIYDF